VALQDRPAMVLPSGLAAARHLKEEARLVDMPPSGGEGPAVDKFHSHVEPQTSDLVKRRYSTRFNNVPMNFDVSTPPMPSLAKFDQYQTRDRDKSTERRPPPSRGGSAPKLDMKAFRDPKLNSDSCE
jgi:hypothetical protein